MNHVDEVFSFTSKVKFYGASFPGRKEGICSKSVRNVGTSSAVFATTERTTREILRLVAKWNTLLSFASDKFTVTGISSTNN